MSNIDAELTAMGKTAPRVTLEEIEASIESEHYFTAAEGVAGAASLRARVVVVGDTQPPPVLGLLTFCVLVLKNGFTVTGESACASPENFDAGIGRKVARSAAIGKVWPLLGFRLRDKLAATHADYRDRVRQEAADLDEKLTKLRSFFETDKFDDLPEPERERLAEQHIAMSQYSHVLSERIAAFPT